jgi:hypothetical protein
MKNETDDEINKLLDLNNKILLRWKNVDKRNQNEKLYEI